MQYESPAGGGDTSSYIDPDPGLGLDGSIVRAPAIENHQRELVDLITYAGLTPDRGDLTQLRQAVLALIGSGSRPLALVAPEYYVATSGLDSNAGSAVAPFLTIQKAVDTFAALDLGGLTGVIHVADGTYTSPIIVGPTYGGGTLSLVGNLVTPGNVIISVTGAHAIRASDHSVFAISGVEIRAAGGPYIGLHASGLAKVTLSTVNFGACAGQYHMQADSHAQIRLSNYAITGAALSHWRAANFGYIQAGGTITITGTPAFAGFAASVNLGMLDVAGITFVGSATGPRYYVAGNAVIYTGGAGLTYLPGNAAGSNPDGGQYL